MIQSVAIATSLLLLIFVVDLVRRGRLREEYSFIWIVCALALVVLSVWRGLLDRVAAELGIHYPPALLLLVLVVFVFLGFLHASVVMSRQRGQIERLVEEVAILNARCRALADQAAERRADGEGTAETAAQRDAVVPS
jgi:hypothetical protein